MLFTIRARDWLDSGIDNTHSDKFDSHGVAYPHYFSEIFYSVADSYCRIFLHVAGHRVRRSRRRDGRIRPDH